jgi:hypothetical protein
MLPSFSPDNMVEANGALENTAAPTTRPVAPAQTGGGGGMHIDSIGDSEVGKRSKGNRYNADPVPNATFPAGTLIISEFRLQGPGGINDEYIEIYNNSGANHTVTAIGTGYAIVASDGVVRCIMPNGTVIPAGGHFLCANSAGYSISFKIFMNIEALP